ncbi:trichohyalin isoform X2 [Etheostoma spectabile]|uniref:trichohyalin isoform X2 n=1 Tax=Etheostoma spectabile TaxID=54343 RepID=UPI0013AF3DF1|nr:trichohyalin-like isoform X2 [Etheostoma spectabile]
MEKSVKLQQIRGIARQKEVAAKLETLQQDCEKKVSQVIREKDDVITSVRKERMGLMEGNLESFAKVRALGTQIRQRQTEGKEKNFNKIQELQKQEWLNREQEWLNKRKHQTKTRPRWQRMKEKAKETEKRLKKERKEVEEREEN